MKQLLLASVLMLLSISLFAQTPVAEYRVATSAVAFVSNLPIGSKIYQVDTRQYWAVVAPITSGGTLADAITANSVKELGSITLGTLGASTIKVRTTTLAEDAVGSQQITLPAATGTTAGLLSAADKAKMDGFTLGAVGVYTVESFEESSSTASDHTLTQTPKNATSLLVSLNGQALKAGAVQYTLTGKVVKITVPVVQFDVVTVSYTY